MNIFEKIRSNPEYSPTNSHKWFWTNVRTMARGLGPMTILGSMGKYQRNAPEFGKMYLYTYSAKHKNKLPYYDAFPLVIPFSKDSTTFTGLNLHYLDPMSRMYVLDVLQNFLNNTKMDETTKMKLSWQKLKSTPAATYFQQCVKRYLYGYIKSNLIEIQPNDWPIAVYLPVERFKNGKPQSGINLPKYD